MTEPAVFLCLSVIVIVNSLVCCHREAFQVLMTAFPPLLSPRVQARRVNIAYSRAKVNFKIGIERKSNTILGYTIPILHKGLNINILYLFFSSTLYPKSS